MNWIRVTTAAVALSCGTETTGADSTTVPPSPQDINASWDAWVSAHAACTTAQDCAVISPPCPLGCFDAVTVGEEAAANAEAQALVDACGCTDCTYSCSDVAGADCVDQRCVVIPI